MLAASKRSSSKGRHRHDEEDDGAEERGDKKQIALFQEIDQLPWLGKRDRAHDGSA